MLSKKYYNQFATMLHKELAYARLLEPEKVNPVQALHNISLSLCDLFEKDNPNFDRSRFLKECGLQD